MPLAVMAAAVTINDVLDGHVVLDVECLDRIYLNGYVPNLQVGGQVASFMTGHLGYPIPSPAIMEKMGTAFRKAVDRFAADAEIPVVRFGKDDRKVEVMRRYLARQAKTGRASAPRGGNATELCDQRLPAVSLDADLEAPSRPESVQHHNVDQEGLDKSPRTTVEETRHPRRASEPVNLNEATVERYLLSILLWLVGSVDPRGLGDLRRHGRFADEPFGVCGVGGVEDAGALVANCLSQAVVDIGGGMQAQPGVAMFIVVPTEEDLAVSSGVFD